MRPGDATNHNTVLREQSTTFCAQKHVRDRFEALEHSRLQRAHGVVVQQPKQEINETTQMMTTTRWADRHVFGVCEMSKDARGDGGDGVVIETAVGGGIKKSQWRTRQTWNRQR